MGYSGGSFASGWAAVLQPEYAPELKDNLIGAALGGFAANLTGIAESVDGEVFSGFIPLALNGIANEYPDFKKRLYEEVKPGAKADLQKVQRIVWLHHLSVIQCINISQVQEEYLKKDGHCWKIKPLAKL